MNSLLSDLAFRVNPEKSRSFSPRAFEDGLARLEQEARAIEAEFAGFRPLRVAIVGTNGKGSTAFALEQCFRKGTGTDGAVRTGLYTSPHLRDFTERIRIDGLPVPIADLEAQHAILRQTVERDRFDQLTYFELLTLLAFRLFLVRKTAVQIFEAGLGGRLDATRIARADAVLITHIGLDHMALLGHTREHILKEKLGICTERCTVLYIADPSLLSSVRRLVKDIGASGERQRSIQVICPFSIQGPAAAPASGIRDESIVGESYLDRAARFARFVYEDLRQRIQTEGSFALTASDLHLRGELTGLHPLPPDFSPAPPPGRMEIRRASNRTMVFDNAHNPAAIYRFLQDLRGLFPLRGSDRVGVIIALLADRRTAPIRRIFRSFGIEPVLQICREGLAPPDPAWQHILPAGDSGDTSPLDPPAGAVLSALREGPLADCPIVLFLGSHRLYDLFDIVSRKERAVEASN